MQKSNSSTKRSRRKISVRLGDIVTVKEPVEAFYSRYAGRGPVELRPSQLGVIGAVHVPVVCRRPGAREFYHCVDFMRPAGAQDSVAVHAAEARYPTNAVHRAAVDESNLVVLRRGSEVLRRPCGLLKYLLEQQPGDLNSAVKLFVELLGADSLQLLSPTSSRQAS